MIDIEYRFTEREIDDESIRRKDFRELERYLDSIVFEMLSADISVKFSKRKNEKEDMIYINNTKITDILDGLDIKIPEHDEKTCAEGSFIMLGGPNINWNEKYIEDIPDILVKNAISKVYCDIQKNRIM